MPSRIVCDSGHVWGGSRRDAALEYAAKGSLGPCECSAPKHWYLDHYYPNWDVKAKHEVLYVQRLWDDREAAEELYDPMLFVICDSSDRHCSILPQYWVNVDGAWKYGQYSPQLRWKDLTSLLNKIPPNFQE